MSADLYAVLGLTRDAGTDDIRRAYRSAAKRAHPDAGGSQAEFEQVALAHDVLSDPERRARYDQTGDASERPKVSEAQQVMGMLAQLLDLALAEADDAKAPRTQTDLAARMRSRLDRMRGDLTKRVASLTAERDSTDALMGRWSIKGKDGADPVMEGILRGRRSVIQSQIEAIERQAADWAKVGDLLKDMVYRADPALFPHQASMLGWAQMAAQQGMGSRGDIGWGKTGWDWIFG